LSFVFHLKITSESVEMKTQIVLYWCIVFNYVIITGGQRVCVVAVEEATGC